jgi:thioesterase domain-containing protein/acyl carrier protein
VTPSAGDLRIALEYRTDLFAAETVDALLATFATLLAAIVRDADQPIGSLPAPIPPPERAASRMPAALERAATPIEGAQHDAQTALRALWEALLDVWPIGINDNFFELGGNSLLAIRLLTLIERSFGIRLSPALLFQAPTIEHLARAMCSAAAVRDRETATVFNSQGTARPLFFLHGSINGGGFYCRTLADRLGPNRPVYAIDPHRFAAGAPVPSIEAMAADNVALVRRIAPHGPYLLGGYCSGGLVAFEMARRLRADGERVANVILLDVPAAPAAPMRHVAQWIEDVGVALHLERRHGRRLVGALASLLHRAARLAASEAKFRFITRRLIEGPSNGQVLDPWFRLTEAYVPRPHDGPLAILLSAAEESPGAAGRGWPALASHAEVRGLPGTHTTCITDFIGEAADIIGKVLAAEP